MKTGIFLISICAFVGTDISANEEKCPAQIIASSDKTLPSEIRNDVSAPAGSSSGSSESSGYAPVVSPDYVDPTRSNDEFFD